MLLFKFESIHQIFIYKALFIKNEMQHKVLSERASVFCLFFVFVFPSVWTLITHNPPSRLTLSFNCIHTSCSVPPVFSHLSPQMFLLDCQKAADLTYRGRNKATGWFLTLFFIFFFQVSNIQFMLNYSLPILGKSSMNLQVTLTCYFTCFSSHPLILRDSFEHFS